MIERIRNIGKKLSDEISHRRIRRSLMPGQLYSRSDRSIIDLSELVDSGEFVTPSELMESVQKVIGDKSRIDPLGQFLIFTAMQDLYGSCEHYDENSEFDGWDIPKSPDE